MIVGIDEVGRGPWAGPLVFGAVVLGETAIEGLTDSKKLTKKKLIEYDALVREQAHAYGLGWVSAEEIDSFGMRAACALGCRRALEQVSVSYSQIIIDGTVNFLKDTGKGPYVTTIKQADLLVPSVSAASIIAKVARDTFMEEQALVYPGYGFEKHVGYGTKAHREALLEQGVSPLHRKSFAPIAALLHEEVEAQPVQATSNSTRAIGDISEAQIAEYLMKQGYSIVDRNWKKTQCEIDIVAERGGVLYFVEVKHRNSDHQGGGLAAITKRKLNQMKFAARVYLHFHGQDNADWRLGVATTSGRDINMTDFFVID